MEQMKMQKIRITHGVVKERNQHAPQFDWEHTAQETHVSSTSDRWLSFDRGDYVEVGRLIKSNALEIASHVKFLVEGIGKKDREVQRLINDKHEVISEVSRVTKELEKEKIARLNVEGELLKRCKLIDCLIEDEDKLWSDVSRLKAELEMEKIERLKAKDQLTKSHKEVENIERGLLSQWKKSVTASFQNAFNQVRLGFLDLDLSSITLDPFKVVEGEQLVETSSQKR